jgi:hypothetical protein
MFAIPRRACMALPLQIRAIMKKSTRSKLALRSQTLRVLGHDALSQVAGGQIGPAQVPAPAGFIMKDTIIIRTGG